MKELAKKLKKLEGEVGKHNKLIIEIFEEGPLGFGKPND